MKFLMNNIGLYNNYFMNFLRMLGLKIRYGKKIKFGKLLCLKKHVCISISSGGMINLGTKIANRDGLHLIAQGGKINIGNHCFFNINCCITSTESITIGSECKFGNNVVIIDHDHNYKGITNNEFISSSISIGENVWIGAGSIILRGTKIGDNVVIAAGSIVKGEIPSGMLYYNSDNAKGRLKKINCHN